MSTISAYSSRALPRYYWPLAILLLLCCSSLNVWAQSAQSAQSTQSVQSANSEPATDQINKKDLPNFHRADEHYLRGGQPTDDGFRQLAKLGVKLVIDLRGDFGDRDEHEQQLVESLGMHYINLPISTFRTPEEKQIQRFLTLIRDNKNLPVFVHCKLGNDRTGLISALYRVEFDHWSGEDAYKEMREWGFTVPLLRSGMKNYLFKYAKQKTDAENAAKAENATTTSTHQ